MVRRLRILIEDELGIERMWRKGRRRAEANAIGMAVRLAQDNPRHIVRVWDDDAETEVWHSRRNAEERVQGDAVATDAGHPT